MFKKRRGIKLPYKEQGLIHFKCLCFDGLPKHEQEEILRLCDDVGKEDSKALFEVLTTDSSVKTVEAIARGHFLSERKLYALRREFYLRFKRELL